MPPIQANRSPDWLRANVFISWPEPMRGNSSRGVSSFQRCTRTGGSSLVRPTWIQSITRAVSFSRNTCSKMAAWPTSGRVKAAASTFFTGNGIEDLIPAGAATGSALTFQLAASVGGRGTGRVHELAPALGSIVGAMTVAVADPGEGDDDDGVDVVE